ncbi:MAG: DUF1801 domain-containing protein [Pseudomonadota bacterium]
MAASHERPFLAPLRPLVKAAGCTPKQTYQLQPVFSILMQNAYGSVKSEGNAMADRFIDSEYIHPDFERTLSNKPLPIQFLYRDIRQLVLQTCPTCNELLYHTHALSSVYSLSDKLKHAFCHIPVYSNHINLGFNFGADLDDPKGILSGSGKKIRHISIRESSDLSDPAIARLLKDAVLLAESQLDGPRKIEAQVISKISS